MGRLDALAKKLQKAAFMAVSSADPQDYTASVRPDPLSSREGVDDLILFHIIYINFGGPNEALCDP